MQDAKANEVDSGTELEDEVEEIGAVEEKAEEEKKEDWGGRRRRSEEGGGEMEDWGGKSEL